MSDCEQSLTPQAYGEVLSTSDVSIFDGNLTCIPVPPNASLNDILAAIDSYVCGITIPTPPFNATDIEYTGQTNFACFNFVDVNNVEDAIVYLANELCSQVGQTYDASDITYTGNMDFSCFSFAGVTNVEEAIEYLANEVCNQSPIGAVCIDDIALCNLNPDVLFCAFGSIAPPELDPPNDHLGSLLELIMRKLCDFNSLTANGVSGLSTEDNGGDTGSQSAFRGTANDYKDMMNAVTKGYSASTGHSWTYKGGVFSNVGLIGKIDDGLGGVSGYIVDGYKVDRAASGDINLNATSDNYIDVTDAGEYTVTAVAVGAPAPPLAGGSYRLYKLETDGGDVLSVTDLQDYYAINGDTIADDAIITRHIADLNVTNSKLDDVVAANTVGDADIISITYNSKGRITAATSNIDITGVVDGQVLQYQSGSGNWENVSIAGGILPAATINQTMYYDGVSWAASSMLVNTGLEIGVGIDNGLPTVDFTLGSTRIMAQNLRKVIGLNASPTGGGSLGAGTYYYVVVAVDAAGGETVLSDEVSASVDGAVTTQIDLGWIRLPIYASYTIYRGTVSSTYLEKQSGITVDTFSDDGTGWIATANPTHTDTTAYSWGFSTQGFRIGATIDNLALVTAANVNSNKTKVASFIQMLGDNALTETYAVEAQNNSISSTRHNYALFVDASGSDVQNTGVLARIESSETGDNIGFRAQVSNGGAGDAWAFYATSGQSAFNDSVAITSTGSDVPDSVAILDLKSITKGFLPPRMTAVQASAITPVEGLILFTTDTNGTFASIGLYAYENGTWNKL